MSQEWADRQRRTNKLVRACYEYFKEHQSVNPETLYALAQLTWITKSDSEEDAGYLKAAKIPALQTIFGLSLARSDMKKNAREIATATGKGLALGKLLESHTGFTNFYPVYRNSAMAWVRENERPLSRIVNAAYKLTGDKGGRDIASKIEELPPIPSPSGGRVMHPRHMITPLVFSLDPRLRFPILNGRDHVRNLLRAAGVTNGSLSEQYTALTSVIGTGGIKDAADLDQVRGVLDLFVGERAGKTRLAKPDETGTSLELKDESDYEILRKNLSTIAKRRHNDLTNRLLKELKGYVIVQGGDRSCRYDALIKDYDEDGDLLVEVKSSTEMADVRMAVGQLYDYHRQLLKRDDTSMAVLLPTEPDDGVKALLEYAEIGLLYFGDDGLTEQWW